MPVVVAENVAVAPAAKEREPGSAVNEGGI